MNTTAITPTESFLYCERKPKCCLRDRYILAGLKTPCAVCAGALHRARELFDWLPEKPGSSYYISTTGLSHDSQREMRKAIADRKHEEAGQMKLAPVDAKRGWTGGMILDLDGFGEAVTALGWDLAQPDVKSKSAIEIRSTDRPRGIAGNIYLDEFALPPIASTPSGEVAFHQNYKVSFPDSKKA